LDVLETAVISRMGASNHLRSVDTLRMAWRPLRSTRPIRPRLGTYTPEIIRLIAEKAAHTGDARKVIELLNAAVERCERRQDGHNATH
jgi:Cdc6-like AAA superfamily ATPase